MSPLPRSAVRRRATASVVAAALAAAACGPTEDTTARELDPATAAVLADAADRLGAALDEDDDCRALAEADALEDRVRVAGESGDAPDDVLRETIRVAATLTAELQCEPADLEDAEDEATEDAPEETPEQAPQDEGSGGTDPAPSDDGGSSGGGGGRDEAPGQNRGQGQNRGSGQGRGQGNGSGGGR